MSTKSVKFGTFANITSGYAFSSKQFNESEQGLPLIRCRDVNTKFAGVYYSGEYAPQYVVEDDDLLLSMDGDFKLLVWKFGKALLNQRVCRLEPDPKTVDKRYLLHFLPRTLDEIHKKTSFATVKHLSAKTVREIEIPLPHKNGKPDLEEQKRIAAILDKADGIRRKRQQALRLTDDFLRSVFLDMFGDPVSNPMGWDVENASDVFESFRYGTSTKCSEKQTSSDQLPVLRIPNVAAEQVNWNNLKYGEIPEAELDRLQLEAGDILFVRTNGNPDLIGRCAMFAGNREAVYASYLIRARLPKDSKTLPSFLHSLLCTDRFRSAIRQMATTSAGNYNINTKSLGSLPFILPPPDLQKQFVRLKNQVTERRTNLSNFASESDELFSSLQQRAFRGEL